MINIIYTNDHVIIPFNCEELHLIDAHTAKRAKRLHIDILGNIINNILSHGRVEYSTTIDDTTYTYNLGDSEELTLEETDYGTFILSTTGISDADWESYSIELVKYWSN